MRRVGLHFLISENTNHHHVSPGVWMVLVVLSALIMVSMVLLSCADDGHNNKKKRRRRGGHGGGVGVAGSWFGVGVAGSWFGVGGLWCPWLSSPALTMDGNAVAGVGMVAHTAEAAAEEAVAAAVEMGFLKDGIS